MLNALELRAAAYALAAGCLVWLGAYLAGLHYKAIIASNAASVAQLAAQAAEAAKSKQDLANANNATVVAGLQSQLDSANASATDFAHRLRNAEIRSNELSQAANKPGAPPASQSDSAEKLTGLLAAAAAECEQNQSRLDALIAEIKPQL